MFSLLLKRKQKALFVLKSTTVQANSVNTPDKFSKGINLYWLFLCCKVRQISP